MPPSGLQTEGQSPLKRNWITHSSDSREQSLIAIQFRMPPIQMKNGAEDEDEDTSASGNESANASGYPIMTRIRHPFPK